MKPKIICYSFVDGYRIYHIAVIKKGFIIDIACSDKDSGMYSEKDLVTFHYQVKIPSLRTVIGLRLLKYKPRT